MAQVRHTKTEVRKYWHEAVDELMQAVGLYDAHYRNQTKAEMLVNLRALHERMTIRGSNPRAKAEAWGQVVDALREALRALETADCGPQRRDYADGLPAPYRSALEAHAGLILDVRYDLTRAEDEQSRWTDRI